MNEDLWRWRDEVIEALVVNCIYSHKHDLNPSLALHDLISWEIRVALDPAVSSDAQALIERGRRSVRKLRCQLHPTKKNETGRRAFGLGFRIGYWPCMKAFYVQFALGPWRVDVWHGMASKEREQI